MEAENTGGGVDFAKRLRRSQGCSGRTSVPSAPASVKALRYAPMNAQKTRGLDCRLRCVWWLVMRRMSSSHVSKNT
jgi:hypothetical protein